MSHTRHKNTAAELLLFSLVKPLWKRCRYRKHAKNLPGKPDLVFPKNKVAVFVDGEFWRGRDFDKLEARLTPFWREKIASNITRDKITDEKLATLGYTVLRFWDKDLKKKNLEFILSSIQAALLRQKPDL